MIRYSALLFRCLATLLLCPLIVMGQQPSESRLGDNAALRYWSAFAQMRDSSITPDQAKELQTVLDGAAPFSDLKYRDLLERNRLALATLQRGTELSQCDWGLEYQLGSAAPVEYVRKALALGRLNVLYALHQLATDDRRGAVRTLSAGIRFSHDLANDGPLIAALAAKTLIVSHLRAVNYAALGKPLSGDEKAQFAADLTKIGPEGVDWQATMRREFDVLAHSGTPVTTSLEDLYRRALQDRGQLPPLQQAVANAPKSIAALIPNPERVLDQRRDLNEMLQKSRLILRK